MSPPKFEIFVIFCYFLRYPKFQLVWQLARQLVYQVCYNRYHVSLYLWLVGSVLKHCKVPKYYDQDRRFRMFISNVYYTKGNACSPWTVCLAWFSSLHLYLMWNHGIRFVVMFFLSTDLLKHIFFFENFMFL